MNETISSHTVLLEFSKARIRATHTHTSSQRQTSDTALVKSDWQFWSTVMLDGSAQQVKSTNGRRRMTQSERCTFSGVWFVRNNNTYECWARRRHFTNKRMQRTSSKLMSRAPGDDETYFHSQFPNESFPTSGSLIRQRPGGRSAEYS